MKGFIDIVKYFLVYFLLCIASFLMLSMIVEYTAFRDDVGFLRFKQEYLHITVWKTAFYVHVFSSIFTLIAGFTQFSDQLLRDHRNVHRFIGKMYVWNILLVNFPAGMIMAFYANGGLPSKAAFIILDSLWFWFTLKGVIEIKRGNITAHKNFMIRSYALTFSAITLRTWKIILSSTFVTDPVLLYMIDAWMGFVPNLLFAEWLIRKRLKRSELTLKPHIVNG